MIAVPVARGLRPGAASRATPWLVVLATCGVLAFAAGCNSDSCKTSGDCPTCQACVRGSCEPIPSCEADAGDANADADGGPDADADVGPDADADGDGDADAGADADADADADGDVPDVEPVCGDGVCEGAESCLDCPGDCGGPCTVCGNGTCDSGESCESCVADCGACGCNCGDDLCDPGSASCPHGETCLGCPGDCGTCPASCGNGSVETGEECDDGNDVSGDGCEPVTCRFTCHGALDCPDDGNVCTAAGYCDATTHVCLYPTTGTDGLVCDEGNPCTGVGSCYHGSCVYSAPRNCDDGLPCTTDGCDPATGECTYVFAEVGTPCDDGLFCMGNDHCLSDGACVGDPGTGVCDDHDTCTEDSCDDVHDTCVHTPVTTYRSVDCSSSFSGNNTMAADGFPQIRCPDGLHATAGGDATFQVTVPSTGTLDVQFSPYDATEEIYLLTDPCDYTSCVAHGAPSATIAVPSAGTYYVVIETSGGWSVEVSCP